MSVESGHNLYSVAVSQRESVQNKKKDPEFNFTVKCLKQQYQKVGPFYVKKLGFAQIDLAFFGSVIVKKIVCVTLFFSHFCGLNQ
jgi:hypothetical protein